MNFDLKTYIADKVALVDARLDELLPKQTHRPKRLHEAMRYSIFAGGKRIRPVLVLASAEALGVDHKSEPALLDIAAAFECIHTYSLIHDDLPAMDDDDLRRGRATCHKEFDEATAILAGDALLTIAFEICVNSLKNMKTRDAEAIVNIIKELTYGSGSEGMIGGQMADMEAEGLSVEDGDIDFAGVQYIHIHKTGALIRSAVRSGAILAKASENDLKNFTKYGENIGLAFQVADDILDIEGSSEELGKTAGADIDRGKATYPSVMGLKESKELAKDLIDKALGSVEPYKDKASALNEIAKYIIERKN